MAGQLTSQPALLSRICDLRTLALDTISIEYPDNIDIIGPATADRSSGFRRLTRDSRNRRLTRDSRIPDFPRKKLWKNRKNRFFGLPGPK